MIKYAIPLVLMLSMCGGKAGGDQPLDPNQRVFGLSADEMKQFCDEVAALFGGYGQSIECDGGNGPTLGPQSQDECVSEVTQGKAKYVDCQETVAQAITCTQWSVQNICVSSPGPAPQACSLTSSPKCSG